MFPTIDKRKTGVNLQKIMMQKNLTVRDVKEYLGLGSVQSVYHWLNGISMPTVDNLYALSELFQMPVDRLICGSKMAGNAEIWQEAHRAYRRRMLLYYLKIKERDIA